MQNLAQRFITGILLAVVITALVAWNSYSFIYLMLVINLLGLREFYRLFTRKAGFSLQQKAGTLLSASLLLSVILVIMGSTSNKVLFVNLLFILVIFLGELYRKAKNPFQNLALTFFGIFYITIPLCFFTWIAFLPGLPGSYHPGLIMGYFLLLWTHDSAAYLVGKKWGRYPLFLRVSPKKTWEGSLGGAACALIAARFIARYFPVLSVTDWVSIACIIIVIGTFGDLLKSLLKRSLHVKDSGSILPGHGGILDRFDSLLSSAPFVLSYLILCRYA